MIGRTKTSRRKQSSRRSLSLRRSARVEREREAVIRLFDDKGFLRRRSFGRSTKGAESELRSFRHFRSYMNSPLPRCCPVISDDQKRCSLSPLSLPPLPPTIVIAHLIFWLLPPPCLIAVRRPRQAPSYFSGVVARDFEGKEKTRDAFPMIGGKSSV